MNCNNNIADYEIIPPRADAPVAQEMRLRRKSDGVVLHAYRFEHPAVAATVVLYDHQRRAVLLGQRSGEPYAGCYCFPGGFLDVGAETVEQAAARELKEEAGVQIDASELHLVDIRSAPDRDPRDHVLDIGYYAQGKDFQAVAADETDAIHWASLDEIENLPLAFDHDKLWAATKHLYHPGDEE